MCQQKSYIKMDKEFDLNVADIRHKLGLSQSEFAELLQISKRTLQKWEIGENIPTGPAITLLRIAKRYPEVLRKL
jgi:putative transcriptional regulator